MVNSFIKKLASQKRAFLLVVVLWTVVWYSFLPFYLLDYDRYLCTNIDTTAHLNAVRSFAGQPLINQNQFCPNFAQEGWTDFYVIGVDTPPYQTNYHFAIAQFALFFGLDAPRLMVLFQIAVLYACLYTIFRLVGYAEKTMAWATLYLFSVFPENTVRIIINGWYSQNLINLAGLLFIWFLISISRILSKVQAVAIGSVSVTIFYYIICLIHNPTPILMFWSNPIDQYRAMYSLLFFAMPAIALSFRHFLVRWNNALD